MNESDFARRCIQRLTPGRYTLPADVLAQYGVPETRYNPGTGALIIYDTPTDFDLSGFVQAAALPALGLVLLL